MRSLVHAFHCGQNVDGDCPGIDRFLRLSLSLSLSLWPLSRIQPSETGPNENPTDYLSTRIEEEGGDDDDDNDDPLEADRGNRR